MGGDRSKSLRTLWEICTLWEKGFRDEGTKLSGNQGLSVSKGLMVSCLGHSSIHPPSEGPNGLTGGGYPGRIRIACNRD